MRKVATRHIASQRVHRAKHDRAFAAAFARQAGLLARTVTKGERTVIETARATEVSP